jgi:hypothetical protein
MLNLPRRMGVWQGAEHSSLITLSEIWEKWQRLEGGFVTSQPPRGATNTQQTSREAQRLTAEVGRQANFPKQGRW